MPLAAFASGVLSCCGLPFEFLQDRIVAVGFDGSMTILRAVRLSAAKTVSVGSR
jgi:hypothetical protein